MYVVRGKIKMLKIYTSFIEEEIKFFGKQRRIIHIINNLYEIMHRGGLFV